jgi:hypothetical protein
MSRRVSHKTSTPIEDRAGPDGRDLQRVRVSDQAAAERLVGAGLDVARVEVDQSGEQPTLITWQREPSPEDRQRAEQLLPGRTVQHA